MILMARVIVKPCTLHHRRTIQFTFNLVNVIFLVHLRCNFYVNILPLPLLSVRPSYAMRCDTYQLVPSIAFHITLSGCCLAE